MFHLQNTFSFLRIPLIPQSFQSMIDSTAIKISWKIKCILGGFQTKNKSQHIFTQLC